MKTKSKKYVMYQDFEKYITKDTLRLVQQGDAEAYKIVLKKVAAYTQRKLNTEALSKEHCRELIGDTLRSVHKAFGTYSINRDFKIWLNSIIDYRVKESRLNRHIIHLIQHN